MRLKKMIVTVSCFSLVFGCATGSVIVTGNVRPAVDPIVVKIYLEPPTRFEIIGLVESSSDVELSSQAAQDRVIRELKKQAAKVGANGVILVGSGERSSGMSGFVSGGVFYASEGETKTAKGQAIYVTQE